MNCEQYKAEQARKEAEKIAALREAARIEA